MKFIFIFFIFFFFILNSNSLKSEDALTVKQQLDRIIEEVKDLNKAVFNKSFDKNKINLDKKNDVERFTSIDIRIYDIEKDIKNLTLQFEETLFKLDDLSNNLKSIENELIKNIEKINNNLEIKNIDKKKEENYQESIVKEENTLGKLIISDKNQVSISESSTEKIEEDLNTEKPQNNKNLSPEELLQFALSQMMKKNYDISKKTLKDFIISFPKNQLSGSAHFWLGKIYLFESDYINAVYVFAEGVQKFPESIKAAEMYYELAKSLKELGKINEACNTLSLLDQNHKGNKFTKDPEKIKISLSCKITN